MTQDSPVVAAIEYDRPGKHFGRLEVPRSTNESGWSNLCVPLITLINGSGPTVLVMGGNHGDEPEGQIAALNLARDLLVEEVQGRLVIIPCLSPEASRSYTRLWPSGANFNRSFPGSPQGSVNEQLADYLSRYLFPLCDAVVDIHSGGRSLMFLPWSEMHLVDDAAQRRAMIEAMLAWNTDYHFIYIDVAGSGLLVGEAERQGKIVVSTELGGGGHVTAEIHRLAATGLRNVLRHFEVLIGEVLSRSSLGLAPTTILRATDREDYLLAPESGLFETLVRLGDRVEEDQPVGRIHFPERPDRAVEVIRALTSGVVCALRAIAPTQQGDCVVVVGQVTEVAELY